MVIKLSTAISALVILSITGGPGPIETNHLEVGIVQDGSSSPLGAWGDSLPHDPQVVGEMMRFRGGGALSPAFAEIFAREVRSRVISAADTRVSTLLTGECVPSLDVTIGEWEFSDPFFENVERDLEKAIEGFDGSLIRTEMVACFQGVEGQPGPVLDLYTGKEFRMAAQDRIQDIWPDPKGSCVETKGAYGLVDPTKVCNKIAELRTDQVAAQHSQVVFNEGVSPYQDVYFKESLKTFVALPDGLALHYINYTRTSDLGRMSRWVGAGKIRDSQQAMADLLRSRLGDIPSG